MKKHVCMIAYTIYEYEVRVRREAEALTSLEGWEVTLLSLRKDAKPKTYRLNGVEVIELNHSRYRGKSNFKYLLSYLRFTLTALSKCTQLLFKRKVDIVHVHNMPNFVVFAGLVPRLCGKSIILDVHDAMPELYAAKFAGLLNKVVYKLLCWEEKFSFWFADRLICVNEVQREKLVRKGILPEKITVILNVPDPALFNQNKRLQSEISKNLHFNLVYHGLFAKRLGIDLIIQAVARLTSEIRGLQLYLIGSGDDRDEFIELRNELGMERYIYVHDPVPAEKLSEILKDMDLGVIANRRSEVTELMLPVKMLEYIALGIPVVAPKLKAIEHYFDKDMVHYFEPENVDSLAQAIVEMYRDEFGRWEQVKKAHTFLERFGWEKHKMDFINFYKQV